MLFLKVIAIMLFLAAYLALLITMQYGAELKIMRHAPAAGFRSRAESLLPRHRRTASVTVALAVAAVVFIETIVQINGKINDPDFLILHLCCAIPFFLILLALRLWITGLRYPRTHGYLAVACVLLYVLTLATGFVLIMGI